jgi:ATP-dependent helicase HrpB
MNKHTADIKLPIIEVIPEIVEALNSSNRLVLQAPPGAGKTTVVPLELLDEPWLADKKILLLEPRRLATVASARRMAQIMGEEVGQTVGYRVRLESRVCASTRIEVITEGILIRMIQDDPELTGVGAILFDEFHERSQMADLGLALAVDVQEGLRDDLRLMLMSATLDGARLGTKYNAPTVSSEGKMFPVEILWEPPRDREWLLDHTFRIVKKTISQEDGSILVFLPGMGEIKQLTQKLQDSELPENVIIAPLYGTLNRREQDRAITPAPFGTRKVVIATNIAETSLTIDGVTVVIDSGVHREPRFNSGSGMTQLVTAPISQASAKQRTGRAGRTAPGISIRLWSQQSHGSRITFQKPEIISAELSSLVLQCALWGVSDLDSLFWFDPPPRSSVETAKRLMSQLGATSSDGRITTEGKEIASIGVHPRLAKIVTAGSKWGKGQEACDLAAFLSERDFLRSRDYFQQADIALRIEQIQRYRSGQPLGVGGFQVDRSVVKRIVDLSNSLRLRSKSKSVAKSVAKGVGSLLAMGFPERVGRISDKQKGRYLLASGAGVHLSEGDPLNSSELIVVADCTSKGVAAKDRNAKVFLAAEISRAEIELIFNDELNPHSELYWESREKRVLARDVVRLGAIIFSEKRTETLDPEKVTIAVIEGIREMGINSLPWGDSSQSFLNRLRFLHTHFSDKWPDMSEDTLMNTLEQWLAPFLGKITKESQFSKIDLLSALKSQFNWEQLNEMDRLAPERVVVPEGSKMKIDYSVNPPVLAVKLQMMFGATKTPTVGDGTVPVTVHLLSPAGSPVQITQDLLGFWDGSYIDVKKDMKGKYKRHPWPDNPRDAVATKWTKRAELRRKKID